MGGGVGGGGSLNRGLLISGDGAKISTSAANLVLNGTGGGVAERAKRVRSAVTVAVLFMLLSALLSSALHVGVRYMSSRLPVFEIVFLRTFLSMLVTLPLVLRPGQTFKSTTAHRFAAK